MTFLYRNNRNTNKQLIGNTRRINKILTSSAIALSVCAAISTCQAASADSVELFTGLNTPDAVSRFDTAVSEKQPVFMAAAELTEVPPGFHRMPDGKIMANSKNSVVPEGFHLMPDGTLMAHDGGGGDHSGHGGGHHHGAGMWMFDYKYMRMEMDGFLDSTRELSPAEVLDENGVYDYNMTATDMTMDMHMFMGMYGITDKVMLMVMAHYMSNTMGMLTKDGQGSTMETSGIGDTVILAMIQGPNKLTFNIGLSIPTGSIDESGPMTHCLGCTPTTDDKYPYGMQLGSGTYDLKQGVEYADSAGKIGWGGGIEYTGRLDENDNGYTLGNVFSISGWVRYDVLPELNATVKLSRMETGQIKGVDQELLDNFFADFDGDGDNEYMSPVMNPDHYGGIRTDLSVKVKYQAMKNLNVSGEVTVPVTQDLNGPQMKTESIIGLGVGFMF